MSVDWTPEDSKAAVAEGWDVFDSQGSENGPWQLQRFDDPSDTHWGWPQDKPYPFGEDTDVWEHVVILAETDSELHNKALDFLKENNPQEYDAIKSWTS